MACVTEKQKTSKCQDSPAHVGVGDLWMILAQLRLNPSRLVWISLGRFAKYPTIPVCVTDEPVPFLAALATFVFYFAQFTGQARLSISPGCLWFLQVAVSSWVAGGSKGYHEVFRTPGEPEVVSPSGDGNL